MRISLCAITFVLSVFPVASATPSQQSAESSPRQKPFVDPCANATTGADKQACWIEVARRAKFFLDADPCENRANQSDEERDGCKLERAELATARLDAYYHSIQKALHADSARGAAVKWDDATLLTGLRDTQAAWARYHALQCEAETTPYAGGTVTFSIKAGCEREKAEARLKELQTTYGRYVSPH